MTRARLAIVSLILLLSTTPIWTDDTTIRFGFPTWALGVWIGAIVYALCVSWLLERYWEHVADPHNRSET